MRTRLLAGLLPGILTLGGDTQAHERFPPGDGAGSLVSVSVDVEGRPAPLYRAPDGSDRFYLQASPHARYALRLSSRTHERLGVRITVDGLNVISGAREDGPRAWNPGRMYVLGPWDSLDVRGWRASLEEVRQFTFVDEERSYAARSGKADARMGWIEVAVYRERRPHARVDAPRDDAGSAGGRAPAEEERADGALNAPVSPRRERSHPGTGWGAPTDDPAMVVDFDPQPHPAERVVLRYEYASALRALGIAPRPWRPGRDRLRERDGGEDGFAQPPTRRH